MNLLIKAAKIIDSNAALNQQIADIRIENGIITEIGTNLNANHCEVYQAENLHVSAGWLDMHANLGEPGFEEREDLISGAAAACFGGFTGIACMPSTNPPIHSKTEVEYLINRSRSLPVEILPIGAVSHLREGKDLSEMFDMFQAGAVAFCDGKQPVESAGLLLRAMLYAKNFNATIINFPDEKSISSGGKMNEGINSTLLGLKGIPALAEEMMIARDIALAEYNDCSIHFTGISSAKSVELIRQAKKQGLKITADISAHQIALDDAMLNSFDTNFKVKPPLRTKQDIESLIQGLLDGTIDAICSDHNPRTIEEKQKEFDHAAFGIIGLETCFGIANKTLSNRLSLEQIINKFTQGPYNILNQAIPAIKEGNQAKLTLFNPELTWTFEKKHIHSKCYNTPFIGSTLKGKAYAIFNKGKFIINKN
jgi:dihydroorotase